MSTKLTSPVLAKVADDEPIFVLRARDSTAVATINNWLLYNAQTLPGDKCLEVTNIMASMRAWQKIHGSKLAD